jgi:hypothetical protein
MRRVSATTAKLLIHACHQKKNVMDTLIVEVEKTKKVARASPVDWINFVVPTALDASMRL